MTASPSRRRIADEPDPGQRSTTGVFPAKRRHIFESWDRYLATRCPSCGELAVDHRVDKTLLRCPFVATTQHYAAASPLGRSVVAAVKAARAEARRRQRWTPEAGSQSELLRGAR